MTLAQAADEMIYKRLQPDDGDGSQSIPMVTMRCLFNSKGMFRGVATSSGTFEVKIWK